VIVELIVWACVWVCVIVVAGPDTVIIEPLLIMVDVPKSVVVMVATCSEIV
jgi:hypothetical protein